MNTRMMKGSSRYISIDPSLTLHFTRGHAFTFREVYGIRKAVYLQYTIS